MVNGRSDALALEGYFLALVVDCLGISLDLGMFFSTIMLSFFQVQVLLL
jgi:hypothetical protein